MDKTCKYKLLLITELVFSDNPKAYWVFVGGASDAYKVTSCSTCATLFRQKNNNKIMFSNNFRTALWYIDLL